MRHEVAEGWLGSALGSALLVSQSPVLSVSAFGHNKADDTILCLTVSNTDLVKSFCVDHHHHLSMLSPGYDDDLDVAYCIDPHTVLTLFCIT